MMIRDKVVVGVCNCLLALRGAPKRVLVDSGSKIPGRVLDLWVYHCAVRIDFSQARKPKDQCIIESFNGSLRRE